MCVCVYVTGVNSYCYSDAVVETPILYISDDEGNNIDLCARLSSASGDILRDIYISFELSPITAGTVTIAYFDSFHTVPLQVLVTTLLWGVYRQPFHLDQ